MEVPRFARKPYQEFRYALKSGIKPNPCGIAQAVELTTEEREQVEGNRFQADIELANNLLQQIDSGEIQVGANEIIILEKLLSDIDDHTHSNGIQIVNDIDETIVGLGVIIDNLKQI
jgi:hypothetical protein